MALQTSLYQFPNFVICMLSTNFLPPGMLYLFFRPSELVESKTENTEEDVTEEMKNGSLFSWLSNK